MKKFKLLFLIVITILLNSCASKYKMINPERLNYNSSDEESGIVLNYKYDLLRKKYEKREIKKGIKVVAVKITNNTDKDIIFGKDFRLVYANGKEVFIMDEDKVYSNIRQSTIGYLFYLLLTPTKLYVQTPTSYSETPIGYVLGPGLAGGNMLYASTSNTNFKGELATYRINGETIKKGETKIGLIGIRSYNFDSLKLKID